MTNAANVNEFMENVVCLVVDGAVGLGLQFAPELLRL